MSGLWWPPRTGSRTHVMPSLNPAKPTFRLPLAMYKESVLSYFSLGGWGSELLLVLFSSGSYHWQALWTRSTSGWILRYHAKGRPTGVSFSVDLGRIGAHLLRVRPAKYFRPPDVAPSPDAAKSSPVYIWRLRLAQIFTGTVGSLLPKFRFTHAEQPNVTLGGKVAMPGPGSATRSVESIENITYSPRGMLLQVRDEARRTVAG